MLEVLPILAVLIGPHTLVCTHIAIGDGRDYDAICKCVSILSVKLGC